MARVLRKMLDEDEELVKDSHSTFWWVGLERVHPSTVNALHVLVLISGEFEDRPGGLARFHINEDGRGVLQDADYVPRIVRALRTGEPQ